MTADENENQARELKFGTRINFSVYIKIPVNFFSYKMSSAVNSWWERERQSLLTVIEYKWTNTCGVKTLVFIDTKNHCFTLWVYIYDLFKNLCMYGMADCFNLSVLANVTSYCSYFLVFILCCFVFFLNSSGYLPFLMHLLAKFLQSIYLLYLSFWISSLSKALS